MAQKSVRKRRSLLLYSRAQTQTHAHTNTHVRSPIHAQEAGSAQSKVQSIEKMMVAQQQEAQKEVGAEWKLRYLPVTYLPLCVCVCVCDQ